MWAGLFVLSLDFTSPGRSKTSSGNCHGYLAQTNRLLQVTTPLGPDVLLLTGFRGHEAISQLFAFELELLAENGTKVLFEKLLGQSVTVRLRLPGDTQRYFNGIIGRFSQGGRDADFTQYRAEMVPQFWLWTKKVQSRIFQHCPSPTS